ncbi:MAG: kelch repeat-containing protein [Planctomycetota bacterium]
MKTHKGFKTAKITFIIIVLVITIVLTNTTSARAGTWTQKADMPTARMGFSTSVVDGKIYAISALQGGVNKLTKVEAYDPATDTWTEKAKMPTSRDFLATSVVDGKIYAIGGKTAWQGGTYLATVEEYDPATDTWTRKADMPTARMTETSVVNGIIYAIGGYRNSVVIGTVEAYDPVTDTWTKKADMPTARGLHSISVVNGKIYALGGQTQSTFDAFATVEVYDPETDTWTRKEDMPVPRIFSTSVVGDKIYGFGGRSTRGGAPLSSVFEYDTVKDTWAEIDTLPIKNGSMGVSTVGGRIYVIGGSSANYPFNSVLSTVWEYDTGFNVPPDFNGDGIVDGADVSIMVDHWHTNNALYDIAPAPWGDGIVDVQDLVFLSEHFFEEVFDSTLVAHWALDETEGMTAHDSANDNEDFVIGGAIWQPAEGMIGGALELDGIDDCIISSAGINSAYNPFSVIAWIKGGTPDRVVISQPGGVNWLMVDAEGNLMTELKGSGRNAAPLLSQTFITDDQWHRIGFVWDGSKRMLFVDGISVAEDIQDSLGFFGSGLYIGVGNDFAAGTFFSGLIDDVRIYNRVVSP